MRDLRSVNPEAPRAGAICDRCGLTYYHHELRSESRWAGEALKWTGFLVCATCLDKPQEQDRPRALPPDPIPIRNPRPENSIPD
jgi:hypothetical protein